MKHRNFFLELQSLCKKHDCSIIQDEMYCSVRFSNVEYSLSSIDSDEIDVQLVDEEEEIEIILPKSIKSIKEENIEQTDEFLKQIVFGE
jgi:hypothetical protein